MQRFLEIRDIVVEFLVPVTEHPVYLDDGTVETVWWDDQGDPVFGRVVSPNGATEVVFVAAPRPGIRVHQRTPASAR